MQNGRTAPQTWVNTELSTRRLNCIWQGTAARHLNLDPAGGIVRRQFTQIW
jgi:hypothetical protein